MRMTPMMPKERKDSFLPSSSMLTCSGVFLVSTFCVGVEAVSGGTKAAGPEEGERRAGEQDGAAPPHFPVETNINHAENETELRVVGAGRDEAFASAGAYEGSHKGHIVATEACAGRSMSKTVREVVGAGVELHTCFPPLGKVNVARGCANGVGHFPPRLGFAREVGFIHLQVDRLGGGGGWGEVRLGKSEL